MNRPLFPPSDTIHHPAVDGLRPRHLVELLQERARRQGDAMAYAFLLNGEDIHERISFAALDRDARRIAAGLDALQGQGERALLLLPSGIDYLRAYFGCLYAGVIAVPAYPPRRNRADARLSAIAEDAQARFILTGSEQFAQRARCQEYAPALLDLHWLVVETLAAEPPGDHWQPPRITADTLAFLQYTSGSTDNPKGVMVTHGNLVHNVGYMHAIWPFDHDSVMISWLPIFHDMGLIFGILQPLFHGRPCYFMSPAAFVQHPWRWLNALSRFAGTHTAAPNFAYELCLEKARTENIAALDLSHWRIGVNGAEPVRADTLERFARVFAPAGLSPETLRHGYGLAEVTLCVSGTRQGQDNPILAADPEALSRHRVVPLDLNDHGQQAASGTVSRFVGLSPPLPETQVVIVDPETALTCPELRIGEIWVAGPSVAQGYWQRTETTLSVFGARLADGRGPFLRTGDLGFLDAGGRLYITGRLKDLIVIRGENYYPQDLEYVSQNSYPGLRSDGAAAFAVSEDGEERLVILQEVERTAMGKLDTDAAMAAIRQSIAETFDLQTQAIQLLRPSTLPKTTSGKVQRNGCRRAFLAGELSQVAAWTQSRIPSSSARAEPDTRQSPHSPGPAATDLEHWLIARLASRLGVAAEAIDRDQPLARHGLDSLTAVALSGELEDRLQRAVPPTLFYDYPTIASLVAHLMTAPGSAAEDRQQPASQLPVTGEAIAIVGLGCRFPGAPDPAAFLERLRAGRSAIGPRPDRLPLTAAYRQQAGERAGALEHGGFLDEIAGFDALHFGLSPREARRMDPQQRLLLEVAWETLEQAGIPPHRIAGTRCGVFVGISNDDYGRLQQQAGLAPELHGTTGLAFSIAANRLSYLLDLRGPSLAIDTACSSSLVAVHQACQSLLRNDCDSALAGGVNLILEAAPSVGFAAAGMLDPDGACRTFDAAANGYVRGEGGGLVLLKRLADAKRDGDRILGVILGSAVNQDGRTNGLTAPNGLSQQAVVRAALARAGVPPDAIDLIETHGTGTRLGDPIEVNALRETLMAGRDPDHVCWIGSVKPLIGHLEAAAGIAGLIKTLLSLMHDEVFPQPHFERLNPLIRLDGSALRIPTARQRVPLRYAGVSGFGFGGTNAHLVLTKAPPVPTATNPPTLPGLLTLSAQNEAALRALAVRHADWLARASATESGEFSREASWRLAALCDLSNRGRSHLPQRLAIPVAETPSALAETLAALRDPTQAPAVMGRARREPPPVVFLFSGQGTQYSGMGQDLYRTEPVFRAAIDRCANRLHEALDLPLQTLLFTPEGTAALAQTSQAQPALFAFGYALAELWQAWGIRPAAVMGHSLGEYLAACVAGCLPLDSALDLVVTRARLMQNLPLTGAMAAVRGPRAQVTAILDRHPEVVIAADNAPDHCTLSGPAAALERVTAALREQGLATLPLAVAHAFHSAHLDPMLAALAAAADRHAGRAPVIPLISNLTGDWLEQAPDGHYWRDHSRQPVQFRRGLETLFAQGYALFLEIGPKPVLTPLGRACAPDGNGRLWLTSLQPPGSETLAPRASLAQLYVAGVEIDWDGVHQGRSRTLIEAPTYPFQREHCWFERPAVVQPGPLEARPLVGAEATIRPAVVATSPDGSASVDALSLLRTLAADILQTDAARLATDRPLLELGADSLTLMQLAQRIEARFGVRLNIRQFFEELSTLDALAAHLAGFQAASHHTHDGGAIAGSGTIATTSTSVPARPGVPEPSGDQDTSPIHKLLNDQLHLVATTLNQVVSQQLAFLQQQRQDIPPAPFAGIPSSAPVPDRSAPVPPTAAPEIPAGGGAAAAWGRVELQGKPLSEVQQRHLDALIARYTRRTAGSRAHQSSSSRGLRRHARDAELPPGNQGALLPDSCRDRVRFPGHRHRRQYLHRSGHGLWRASLRPASSLHRRGAARPSRPGDSIGRTAAPGGSGGRADPGPDRRGARRVLHLGHRGRHDRATAGTRRHRTGRHRPLRRFLSRSLRRYPGRRPRRCHPAHGARHSGSAGFARAGAALWHAGRARDDPRPGPAPGCDPGRAGPEPPAGPATARVPP
jgi:acyl transferase domain-containing protein/acyl-CoA synthetase (AMP-forming)/AMP-acid ligase II